MSQRVAWCSGLVMVQTPRLSNLKHTHRDFLFSSIPPSPPNKNIPYWSCPLCTPSLTLPPSSLKCLQKSNPNIHRKCFRCFKCFGCFRCFISLLDHKTARFWSKSEQNPKNRYSPTSAIKWVRKTPKKAIHPLVYEHDPVLQAIGAVVFRQSRLFVRATRGKPAIGDGVLWKTFTFAVDLEINSMQAEGEAEAQLGVCQAEKNEPQRGTVV